MGDLPDHAIRKLLDLGLPLAADRGPADPELGRYRVVRELGRGGMGVVYEAFDEELQRRVALKVNTDAAMMSESARQRFVREAQAAARLAHPHIAAVYDATPDHIAMQLVDGVVLSEVARGDDALLVGLVRDAARAVHAAHEVGIVHRDLKPSNLMVERPESETPHVYVMDFGLAKEMAVDSSLSLSGHILGTPAFMSPEQASGGAVSRASDVYSLGATLYAVLTGRPPFPGRDIYDVLHKVREVDPPPPRGLSPHIPRDLEAILLKCLDKDPARRYRSAAALADDLDRWLSGEAVEARRPSAAYRLSKYLARRRSPLKPAVFVLVVALLVFLPLWLHQRERRATAERSIELAAEVSRCLYDAESHFRDGDPKRAQEVLQAGIDECRRFLESHEVPHARYFLGRLLRARGLDEDARRELTRALAMKPELADARFERGLLLAERYQDLVSRERASTPDLEALRRDATGDIESSLGRTVNITEIDELFGRAQLAWLGGDAGDAIRRLRRILARDTSYVDAHLALSRIYLARGEDAMAMAYGVSASDLLRGFAPAYQAREDEPGPASVPPDYIALAGGRLLFDFRAAVRRDPRSSNSYADRALLRTRRMAESKKNNVPHEVLVACDLAIADYNVALLMGAPPAGVHNNRGVCHLERALLLAEQGQADAAVEARTLAMADFDAALAADPTLAAAWINRGRLHLHRAALLDLALRRDEAQRERAAARADLEHGLAARPHPWTGRAAVEAELERLDVALE